MVHNYLKIFLEKEEAQTLINLIHSECGRIREELSVGSIKQVQADEELAFYYRLGNNIFAEKVNADMRAEINNPENANL